MTVITKENFKIWQFPGGERGVTLTNINLDIPNIRLIWRICNSNDLIDLLLAVDSIKRTYPDIPLDELILPYLPYARQDRIDVEGGSFSLKVVSNILDNLGFKHLTTYDVHSSVTAACFNKTHFYSKSPTLPVIDWIRDIGLNTESVTIISPDQGAVKRAMSVAQAIGASFVSFNKIRDAATGKVIKLELLGTLPQTIGYLVVDDICDGGATFIEVAQKLQLPKEQMFLFTTHGIYSKGFDELKKHYKRVGSTNSYQQIEDSIFYRGINIV